THGLAWLATYVEAVRQLASYAARLTGEGTLGELEELLIRIGLGEYLAQGAGGIPVNQNEGVRLSDLGLALPQIAAHLGTIAKAPNAGANTAERRRRLFELISASHGITVGVCGLEETLESIRVEMRRFADAEVIGHAQGWHRTNSYIPLDIIKQMSELGVF